MKRQREVTERVNWTDPNQRNLFDVYEENENFEKTEKNEENSELEDGVPMVDFGALNFDDDPLLAIVAEHILNVMENEKSSGNNVIHFKDLVKKFIPLAIREEEVDEAISILLQKKMIIELHQDTFGLEN